MEAVELHRVVLEVDQVVEEQPQQRVLVVGVACAACAAELQRQARVQLWSFSAIFLGLQAAVTSSQLSAFRLFCAVL